MALALYRRYRPDTFDGVIGQDQVTIPLSKALDNGRLTHAYLFSGPRGCGKTSSARILARCINCEQGPTSHPCGECASCKDLATGGPGSIDVVEIDAASHNGVEDARELRERAAFAPARDRYKIFILDEAHMVTSQGFNALLKIVEEPPEHVMFIFATTEPDKVIGTIRSRTHHYPFRLVPQEVMGPFLEHVCVEEHIEPEPGVLKLAMRAGGGSVRDTLSVLDQLMVGAEDGRIAYDAAVALLGFTPDELIGEAIDAVVEGDGESLYGVIQNVVVGGFEPRRFVEDLLSRVRDMLVLTLGGAGAASVLGDDAEQDLDGLNRQAKALGLSSLSAMAEIIDSALADMVGATSPRMRLELLAARLLAGRENGFAEVSAPASGNAAAGAAPVAGGFANASASAGNGRSNFVGSSGNGNAGGAVRSGFAGARNRQPNQAGVPSSQPAQTQGQADATHSANTPAASTADPAKEHNAATTPDNGAKQNVAGNVPNDASGETASDETTKTETPTLSAVQKAVLEHVGQVDTSASPDEKWDMVLKALPEGVGEYVSRDKVPEVVLETNQAGRSRLAMTFDSALSQHAFALALASDADNNGQKASHVVLETVRVVFGPGVMIAPTGVAANGEQVVSTKRMKPEELAQVKRKIALAKVGLPDAGAALASGHEGSQPKTRKKAGEDAQPDADDSAHRTRTAAPEDNSQHDDPLSVNADKDTDPWAAGVNAGEPSSLSQDVSDQASMRPDTVLDDPDYDPWQHPMATAGTDRTESASGSDASVSPASQLPSESAPQADNAVQHKHVSVPDVGDGVDPWAVPEDGNAEADGSASQASSTASSSTVSSSAGASSESSDTRSADTDRPSPQDRPDLPRPDFDRFRQRQDTDIRSAPQVAAEDDDYSLDDQSLGAANAMSVDDLKQLFEVKKVEEFAATDPKNPKNVKAISHHPDDQ